MINLTETNVAIIVLNWQGWQDTLECLDSLTNLISPGLISIIVCDNGSEDESMAQILNWAQQHYLPSEIGFFREIPAQPVWLPWVLIQTGANLGFAGGNNIGIRYALATQKCEYLWLLNNDTIVEAHALIRLCEYAACHPQYALIGSTLLDYYQREKVQCAGGCRYFPLLTIFRPVGGGQPLEVVMQWPATVRLDYVAGAAMWLRAAVIPEVGVLNEEYFLFYEELDYTQRLIRQGYQIGWCKHSLVYHKGSASVGNRREGNQAKLQRANYYENLSTLKYTARFYPKWLPVVMVLRFCLKSLVLISRGDFYLLIPLWQAYQDFLWPRRVRAAARRCARGP